MSAAPKCPKCDFLAKSHFSECPRCGIIVSKFLERDRNTRVAGSPGTKHENPDEKRLADANALIVRQNKEWGEIVTGFETKNRYQVMDPTNNPLLNVEEMDDSFIETISRLFLKASRPFKMKLFSLQGTELYRLTRPFRFYFHELEVYKADGTYLGHIKRQFSILRRIYTVFDKNGNEAYRLFGPFFHPWTFQINRGMSEAGEITKKWSGLTTEFFTDADNFGIIFPDGTNIDHKAILLGAVFLIDFVHFENKGGNN